MITIADFFEDLRRHSSLNTPFHLHVQITCSIIEVPGGQEHANEGTRNTQTHKK